MNSIVLQKGSAWHLWNKFKKHSNNEILMIFKEEIKHFLYNGYNKGWPGQAKAGR
jgi:hypothetical protein